MGVKRTVGSRSGRASALAAVASTRLMGSSASAGGGAPASRAARTTWPRKRASNSASCSEAKSSPYHQNQSEPSAA